MSIYGVRHYKCISNKCAGISLGKSRKIMREIAKGILKKEILDAGIIDNLIEKYPDIEGESIEIPIE